VTVNIDSDQGRIGELWWINSDLQPIEKYIPAVIGILELGMVMKARLIRWGTCGVGRNVRVYMEPIDD
jgi:hypothetical protein